VVVWPGKWCCSWRRSSCATASSAAKQPQCPIYCLCQLRITATIMTSGPERQMSAVAQQKYLPGLTMPAGHLSADLINPDAPEEVENAYIEVCSPSQLQDLLYCLYVCCCNQPSTWEKMFNCSSTSSPHHQQSCCG